jgi:hypothetical protein
MGTLGKRWEVKDRQKYKDILTKEILIDATVRKILDYTLSSELKIPVTAIQWYRHKWKIPSARADSEVLKMRSFSLTPEDIGLIIGAVLGDGCLAYSEKRDEAYFTVMHGIAQKEYVEHKHNILEKLCLMNVKEIETDGYSKGIAYYFSTIWHPDLAKLYKMIYINGIKSVSPDILELLTIAGFVWWFFDDGSLSKNLQQYSLATCQFPLEQQKLIREYLFDKLDIYSTIIKTYNKKAQKYYYSLYIPTRSNERLASYLKSFSIPCMNYKICSAPQRLIRKASINNNNRMKIQSELHSDMKSDTEMISPLL